MLVIWTVPEQVLVRMQPEHDSSHCEPRSKLINKTLAHSAWMTAIRCMWVDVKFPAKCHGNLQFVKPFLIIQRRSDLCSSNPSSQCQHILFHASICQLSWQVPVSDYASHRTASTFLTDWLVTSHVCFSGILSTGDVALCLSQPWKAFL